MTTWDDLNAASDREMITWASEQTWAKAMAACKQDATWHAEGDVWTHTQLVIAELTRLNEWPTLDRDTQLILLVTALFHDAGKPATTIVDPETGRTHAPKHAMVGMELCRAVLRELQCDLATRERICSLVRYHGRPPYLLEKPDPARFVIGTSWLSNNRLLYLFTLADSRGRTTTDTARTEENLHLWRLACEEQAAFETPYPFVNDQARVLFFRDQLSSLHYVPQEDYRCTVTMMSGLPGAGKDRWLATQRPELPVVSLDELRTELDVLPTDSQGEVIQAARERCREFLRAKQDFAFNATNTLKLTRQRWYDLFFDYRARVEVVYLEPDLDTLRHQNKQRAKAVPWPVIEKLLRKLEPPTLAEVHGLQFG